MKKFICIVLALICFVSLCGFDFMDESNLTDEQLEKGLLYELKPLAGTFIDIEEEYGINSTLYASIVALESGWGRSKISRENNNITSFTDRHAKNGHKVYESKEDCLWDMAKHLSQNYLAEDGMYNVGGTSLEDVVCYYLVGKRYDEMTKQEIDKCQAYIDLAKQINNQINRRAEAY